MSDQITFGQLEAVLADLGFRQTVVPGSHVTYRHDPSDTILMVRPHQPDDIVPWHVLAAARRQLDGRGVIGEHEFDDRLQAAAA